MIHKNLHGRDPFPSAFSSRGLFFTKLSSLPPPKIFTLKFYLFYSTLLTSNFYWAVLGDINQHRKLKKGEENANQIIM
jgi:hypothetical protein